MRWFNLNIFSKRLNFSHLEGNKKTYFENLANKKYQDIYNETFTVLDFETSGLDVEKDRILSFAFLKIKKQQILIENRFEGYVNNNQNESVKSSKIHHITNAELSNGISEEIFFDKALNFIGDSLLVGHHIAFDKSFLDKMAYQKFNLKLPNKTIDTAKLGARINSPINQPYTGKIELQSLDNLCKTYHVTPEARHSAGGDTLTTAILFLKLLKAAKKRGIKNLI